MRTLSDLEDAGALALELVNTSSEGVRGEADPLSAPGTAIAWLHRTGAASDADVRALRASPPLSRALHTEALRLREALRALFGAFSRGTLPPVPAMHVLNRVFGAHRTGSRLEARGADLYLIREVEGTLPLGALAAVAMSAAELLARGHRARLRTCDGDGCGRWYYDTSRNRSRRWCSMARCGNRTKVAAFRRRARKG